MKTYFKLALLLALTLNFSCAGLKQSSFKKSDSPKRPESLQAYAREIAKKTRSFPESANSKVIAYRNSDTNNCSEEIARAFVEKYNKDEATSEESKVVYLTHYCTEAKPNANPNVTVFGAKDESVMIIEIVEKSIEKTWVVKNANDLKVHRIAFPNSAHYRSLENDYYKKILVQVLGEQSGTPESKKILVDLQNAFPSDADSLEITVASLLKAKAEKAMIEADAEYEKGKQENFGREMLASNRATRYDNANRNYKVYNYYYPEGKFKSEFDSKISEIEELKKIGEEIQKASAEYERQENERKVAEERKKLTSADITNLKQDIRQLQFEIQTLERERDLKNSELKSTQKIYQSMSAGSARTKMSIEIDKLKMQSAGYALKVDLTKKKLEKLYDLVPEMRTK